MRMLEELTVSVDILAGSEEDIRNRTLPAICSIQEVRSRFRFETLLTTIWLHIARRL